MSDEMRVRKDGRPLITEHPVTWQDEIEIYDGPIPDDVIQCRASREPRYEAWMDDF